ncbi:hypothetical protein JXM67_00010 [candidate division WOR-3 bacterium]|nr:hypothetical protein [candidate division WOR-3 bacterium]
MKKICLIVLGVLIMISGLNALSDAAAWRIFSPGRIVLRWTEIEPEVEVANLGDSQATYDITLEIWEEDGATPVYSKSIYGLSQAAGEHDTLSMPGWMPEEFNTVYIALLIVDLDTEENPANDTFSLVTVVACDDTLGYDWDFTTVDTVCGNASQEFYLGQFYPAENGVLVTGARCYIARMPDPAFGNPVYPALAMYEADAGAGGISDPPSTAPVKGGKACCETYQEGWNNVHFGYHNPKTGQYTGVFVHSASDGNTWAGLTASSSGWTGSMPSVGLKYGLVPHPCYNSGALTQTRSADWNSPACSGWPCNGAFNWRHLEMPTTDQLIVKTDTWNYPIELFVHLGFGPYPMNPKPGPPYYLEEPHDLTAYRFEKPYIDWIEDGEPLEVKLGIANLGRQAEPDDASFPIKLFVVEVETGDTFWSESLQVIHIGWPGDTTDNPDTLLESFTPFELVGACVDWQVVYGEPGGSPPPIEDVGVDYEFIGLVRLGEVGPDLSDHCPYNDTTRMWVSCLLSHDVGVVDLQNEEGHPWGGSWTDPYPVGAEFTCIATVENFGFYEEHDFTVDIEIYDCGPTPDSLVWRASEPVNNLDWRGNDLGNPHRIDVTFPTWTTPSKDWFRFEARTELKGDECPVNDELGTRCWDAVTEVANIPSFFSLEVKSQALRSDSRISFSVPHSSLVEIAVFDINGRLVKSLVDDEFQPGQYERTWDGVDFYGRKVAAGIYLIRMEAEGFEATRKVVIID